MSELCPRGAQSSRVFCLPRQKPDFNQRIGNELSTWLASKASCIVVLQAWVSTPLFEINNTQKKTSILVPSLLTYLVILLKIRRYNFSAKALLCQVVTDLFFFFFGGGFEGLHEPASNSFMVCVSQMRLYYRYTKEID